MGDEHANSRWLAAALQNGSDQDEAVAPHAESLGRTIWLADPSSRGAAGDTRTLVAWARHVISKLKSNLFTRARQSPIYTSSFFSVLALWLIHG